MSAPVGSVVPKRTNSTIKRRRRKRPTDANDTFGIELWDESEQRYSELGNTEQRTKKPRLQGNVLIGE